MQLEIKNFGGFTYHSVRIDVPSRVVLPNNGGKTTIINAYVFALSGKGLSGFECRNVNAPANEPTEVILQGFIPEGSIRRTLSPDGGTELYVDGNYTTQSAFAARYPIEFICACANVNLLTNPDLSSEKLRKLLAVSGAIDNGRSAELRAEQARVRALRRNAEGYALSNVVIPTHQTEPLTTSAEIFLADYERYADRIRRGVETACRLCGRDYSDDVVKSQQKELETAKHFVETYRDEYERIQLQQTRFEAESVAIADAQRLLDKAKQARGDLQAYDKRLAEIENELRVADAEAIGRALPEGVKVIVDKTTRTGKTSSVCTLTYNDVPLKSVNRGARIKICIELLRLAMMRNADTDWPILVDNAESVQGLDQYTNVVQFIVG